MVSRRRDLDYIIIIIIIIMIRRSNSTLLSRMLGFKERFLRTAVLVAQGLGHTRVFEELEEGSSISRFDRVFEMVNEVAESLARTSFNSPSKAPLGNPHFEGPRCDTAKGEAHRLVDDVSAAEGRDGDAGPEGPRVRHLN